MTCHPRYQHRRRKPRSTDWTLRTPRKIRQTVAYLLFRLRTYCDCTSSQEDQTATTEATGDVDEAGAATDSAIETAAAEQDQVTEEPEKEKVEAETDPKSAAVSAETSAPEQQPETEMPAAPDGRKLWIGTGKSNESKPRKCTGPTGSSLGGDGRGRKRRER